MRLFLCLYAYVFLFLISCSSKRKNQAKFDTVSKNEFGTDTVNPFLNGMIGSAVYDSVTIPSFEIEIKPDSTTTVYKSDSLFAYVFIYNPSISDTPSSYADVDHTLFMFSKRITSTSSVRFDNIKLPKNIFENGLYKKLEVNMNVIDKSTKKPAIKWPTIFEKLETVGFKKYTIGATIYSDSLSIHQ